MKNICLHMIKRIAKSIFITNSLILFSKCQSVGVWKFRNFFLHFFVALYFCCSPLSLILNFCDSRISFYRPFRCLFVYLFTCFIVSISAQHFCGLVTTKAFVGAKRDTGTSINQKKKKKEKKSKKKFRL